MTWTLHHGDCLDPVTGLASLADKSVDHVISDPPYSAHTHSKQWPASALNKVSGKRHPLAHSHLDFDALTYEQAVEAVRHASRVARRWSVFFTDLEGISTWRDAILEVGEVEYVRACIWDKVDSSPQFTGDRPAASAEAFVLCHGAGRKRWNGGGSRNVFRFPVNANGGPDTRVKPHPTTKPLPLMRHLIELFTDENDTILDPFAGSGTTGVACNQLGRHFIGWERDANYHAIATRRLRGDEAKPNPAQPSLFGGAA